MTPNWYYLAAYWGDYLRAFDVAFGSLIHLRLGFNASPLPFRLHPV